MKTSQRLLWTAAWSALAFPLLLAGCQGGDIATAPQPASKTQYTCTMHPEVVQGGPGKCPKCGMDLIPKD